MTKMPKLKPIEKLADDVQVGDIILAIAEDFQTTGHVSCILDRKVVLLNLNHGKSNLHFPNLAIDIRDRTYLGYKVLLRAY